MIAQINTMTASRRIIKLSKGKWNLKKKSKTNQTEKKSTYVQMFCLFVYFLGVEKRNLFNLRLEWEKSELMRHNTDYDI